MITASISDFSANTKKYLTRVADDFETLIIHRDAEKVLVLISLEEYNSIQATLHEMSSKKNREALDHAIEQVHQGKTFQKDLIEE